MNMSSSQQTKNIKKGRIICLAFVIVVLALFLEAGILYNVNIKNANKTSQFFLKQAISVIEKNERTEKEMIQSLKEDYIVRAKAVSYIIDANPKAEKDLNELKKIAKLISVDEIHLFDTKGKIYSGTVPKYYGYSFESGKQLEYFKPMLQNKKRTMCQDVTPNTSEGKSMMYAITWNEAGTHMVQVGIEPVRLINEVKQNAIFNVVNNMPMYKGLSIYVANQESGVIYGATDKSKVGKKLDEVGFPEEKINQNQVKTEHLTIDGKRYNCTFEKSGEYVVGVTFDMSADDENNGIAILIVGIYLSLATACILFVISRSLKRKEEVAILSYTSNIDELTECFNRRAYERDILTLSKEVEFIYISMDVNGLKIVNDSLGHMAGDELLKGAAFCMKQCFEPYGKVYRVGGDEFIAILHVNADQFEEIREKFYEVVKGWSGQQTDSLTISCGAVSSTEQEWNSISEIVDMADIRMYEKKAMYYGENGVDRRGQPAPYVTLCKLYSEILKVNLNKDNYKVLNITEGINIADNVEEQNCLSEWLQKPVEEGTIYAEDLKEYIRQTRTEYLKEYFDKGKNVLTISYRRKVDGEYKRVTLDVLASDTYVASHREVFLYVKYWE